MRICISFLCFVFMLAFGACGKSEVPIKDQPTTSSPNPEQALPSPNPSMVAPASATTGTEAAVQPAANGVVVDAPAGTPVVKVAWSYYTSWSLIAAAEDFGLIAAAEGKQGSLEQKEGVDLVLNRAEYVDTMNVFSAGGVDAVMVTNTDVLAMAQARKEKVGDASVAVFSTSYSYGADKILCENSIKSWADLKGVPVKGAEASVTQYLFWRACQVSGVNYADYKFENLDPVQGAPLFVGKQDGFRAWGGWSPETFTILDGRPDVVDIFNSSMIDRYEITDMVVVGQSVLDRPGGANAVKALAAVLAQMGERTQNPATRSAALQALSKRFNDLKSEYLTRALDLTLVTNPTKATDILGLDEFKKTLPKCVEFAKAHKLIAADVAYAWGTKEQAPTAVVRFDNSLLP